MRILTVLTYYRPHTSGLTIYAERLAKALAKRGHQVTVLTSQFDKSTPLEEKQDGVRIRRVPVLLRISKGVIMPSIGRIASEEIDKHDALLLHLPQFDAAGLALRGRLRKKPTVIIYHSDLTLPKGLFNLLVSFVINLMNDLAARFTHRISSYTEDFANHSPYLRRFADKVRVISPAVELPKASAADIKAFGGQHNPQGKHPVIAMATRFAAEKGVEVLLKALPRIFEKYPSALVWFAGQYENVLGEEEYFQRLMPEIEQYQKKGQWVFLGNLDLRQMAAFYPNIDVLVVPSTNSTETFGFVQIEAMMNGKPVVASELPGVRQPVRMTGMGRVTPVGDAEKLAENLIELLGSREGKEKGERRKKKKNGEQEKMDAEELKREFSPDTCAQRHEELFLEIAKELKRKER
ncbi:MAG: glycosyltransferase family 4 protein [Chloroflexi bacterium]|nr:glycosyltransferase family 4 protein [Chloroflexota bacterium]